MGDALTEHDVELGLLERRGHLVLHHLDSGAVAQSLLAVLELCGLAHVDADGGVEFQCVTTCRGLRVAEHHADFLPELVDEYAAGVGLGDVGRQFPQCLAHQPCLKSDLVVAHLTFDLRLRSQGCDRVNHHDVNRSRTDQVVGDLKRLFAVVRL